MYFWDFAKFLLNYGAHVFLGLFHVFGGLNKLSFSPSHTMQCIDVIYVMMQMNELA